MAGEKTEKATPRKRQKARRKGQVAKSADVNTALILLVVFIVLMFFGASFVRGLLQVFQHSLAKYTLMEVTPGSVETMFVALTLNTAKMAAPIVIVAFVAAIGANYAQVGFRFSPEAIQFKPG
ncbi:MAG TPA: EscU/YscU/HrcU family type III secretion system export apparatus switch protein, partial [Bacillales bacterium]|nr:EscU/YscU/HrcU family type III secretion system export apparatus switch protein [Bacillales bacterium]